MNIPPALICAVFTPGKKLSYDFVPIAYKPCPRLVFLGKSPALALLPVPPGDGLAAGRLYLIPDFIVLDNAVIIDCLALAVDCFHSSTSFVLSPRPADRAAFESTLSICLFAPYTHGDTLHIGVCELIRLYPFCNVLERHCLVVLSFVVYARKIAPDAHLVFFRLFHSATSIFSMQSPQMRLTALVARTLFLQHGQIYFRVLLRFGGCTLPPGCVPLFPALPPLLGGGVHPPPRFIWISVQPCAMM